MSHSFRSPSSFRSLATQHAVRRHLGVGLPGRLPVGQQHPAEPRVARGEPLPDLPVQRGQEADHDAHVSPGGRGHAPPPTQGGHGGRPAGPDRAQHIRLPGQDLPPPHPNQAGGGALLCLVYSACLRMGHCFIVRFECYKM